MHVSRKPLHDVVVTKALIKPKEWYESKGHQAASPR